MTKAKWIRSIAASVAILVALGTGLWFGGGPSTRDGWEAASWDTGITAAMALIITAVAWATTSRLSTPTPPPGPEERSDTVNTVNGHVSGGTLIQGHNVHVDNPSYGGDHIDFSNGDFHGPVVGKQVHHHHATRQVNWPIRVGAIPEQADHYQHRTIADQLDEAVNSFGTVVLRQVLSGTGGVGKTQLAAHHARALAHITNPEERVEVLIWANASTREHITSAYAHAAHQLYATVPDAPEDAAQLFLTWLRDPNKHLNRRWLIVWDNLTDPAHVQDLWPPHDQPHGRVLVTTRRRDHSLTTQGRHLIEVDVYTAHEARAFLTNALDEAGIDHTDTDLDTLADTLGRLPLALGQAVPYMAELGMGCDEYLQVFHDRVSTLRKVFPDWETETLLATTWDLSLTVADTFTPQGLARPLMGLIALLDGNGIPEQVFTAPPVLEHLAQQRTERLDALGAGPEPLSPQQVRAGLAGLRRLNLITRTTQPRAQGEGAGKELVLVGAHQLVQRATREHTTTRPTAQDVQVLAHALSEVWPKVELATVLVAQRLRANTTVLRSHPVVQGRSSEAWLWESGAYAVLFHAGESLGESGHVQDAVVYWEDMHRMAEQHLGRKHLSTLVTRHSIARWRGEAGDPQGAITVLEQLLPDSIRVLGRKDLFTLTVRHNIADWRGHAGDSMGAANALRKVLRLEQRVLGSDHPSVFNTRANIARWRGKSGELGGAYTAYEGLLVDRIRVLGFDHPDTLATRFSIARLRDEAGDSAGAATMYEQLLPDCIRILGPDHESSFATRNNLASCLGRAGDPEGAATALEQLLADEQRVLGADHPGTLTTRHNIAHWRGEAGSPEGALTAYENLLADRIRVLGPDHPEILTIQAVIAYCHREAGDLESAIAALQHLLPGRIRALGPDHWSVFDTRAKIARWRGEAGDPEGAITAYEELLADRIRVLGPDHPVIAVTHLGLAVWKIQSSHVGVINHFVSKLRDQKRELGSDHPETQRTEELLRIFRGEEPEG